MVGQGYVLGIDYEGRIFFSGMSSGEDYGARGLAYQILKEKIKMYNEIARTLDDESSLEVPDKDSFFKGFDRKRNPALASRRLFTEFLISLGLESPKRSEELSKISRDYEYRREARRRVNKNLGRLVDPQEIFAGL